MDVLVGSGDAIQACLRHFAGTVFFRLQAALDLGNAHLGEFGHYASPPPRMDGIRK